MSKISTSTLFLRAAIIFIGLVVLALCIFALPSIYHGGSVEFPTASTALLLIMIGMYVAAVPFYIGLSEAWKLLGYIDRGNAFSDLSVRALRNIKRSAGVIAILYFGGVPLLFPIAEADDAPGLILFGTAFACAPLVVTVFAAVLQRLLQDAIALKSENDLTV